MSSELSVPGWLAEWLNHIKLLQACGCLTSDNKCTTVRGCIAKQSRFKQVLNIYTNATAGVAGYH